MITISIQNIAFAAWTRKSTAFDFLSKWHEMRNIRSAPALDLISVQH